MKKLATSLSLLLGLALGFAASTSHAGSGALVVSSQADSIVQVTNLKVEGETVQGLLVNKSSQTLRDVRVVVRNAWIWSDERNPGTENPGSSEFFTFPGEIPPGGSAPFTHRLKAARSTRSDGKFVTSAEVLSYVLVGS